MQVEQAASDGRFFLTSKQQTADSKQPDNLSMFRAPNLLLTILAVCCLLFAVYYTR